MDKLQPKWWLSGHMHVRFEATCPNKDKKGNDIGTLTKFLALDKAMNDRPFLEILTFDPPNPNQKVLSYDPEWLAIQRLCVKHFPTQDQKIVLPQLYTSDIVQEHVTWVEQNVSEFLIPLNFHKTAPGIGEKQPKQKRKTEKPEDPQTLQFLKLIGRTEEAKTFRCELPKK